MSEPDDAQDTASSSDVSRKPRIRLFPESAADSRSSLGEPFDDYGHLSLFLELPITDEPPAPDMSSDSEPPSATEPTDLSKAKLYGANLTRVHLEGVNLRDARLNGAKLVGAKLIKTDLTGADLRGANLRGADLSGATLTDAVLVRIEPEEPAKGIKLLVERMAAFVDGLRAWRRRDDHAEYEHADEEMSEYIARHNTDAILKDVIVDGETQWPAGFNWQRDGSVSASE